MIDLFPSSSQEGSDSQTPARIEERGVNALGHPLMDDFSFEETLISPSILAAGVSTSFLHLASLWGLGRTFGDSEELAGGRGGGQRRGTGAAVGTGSR